MPPASYESLQSDIEKQKTQIETQRETIQTQRTIGERSIQSLKRVHPRTPPSVYFGQIQPQIEQVKGRITQLETAEKELTVAEQQLSEQESVLAKRKAEGYKVRETAEGIEFFKPAPTPKKPTSPYGNVQRTETHEGKTIAIHYDTGITVYPQQHMIKIPGEPFQKLPSHPEFQPVMLDRHTSVERHLVNWYRGKQEQERLGVIAKTETRILTEAEIDKLLAGKTQSEKLAWYKKTAEFGVEGEEKRPWSEIKKEHPDWKLTIKDGEPVIETPETIEQAKFETHKELLRKRITAGTPVERLQEFTRFVSSVFIKPLTVADIAARGLYGEGEKALDILARQSFEFKEKDVPEIFVESYKPGGYGFFVTVGALFQAGMAGIGKAGISAAGTKTGTVLAGYAKYAPLAFAGTFSAIYGTDIGITAAYEEVGAVPKGETLSKIFGGVAAVSLIGAGSYLAGKPFTMKPIAKKGIEITEITKPGVPFKGGIAQKYVEVFGKRVLYGKRLVGIKPDPLFVKTFDPYLGYARVAKYGVRGVTPTVVGEPPAYPSALVVRPTGALVPTRIPITTIDYGPKAKALFRIPLEPKTRVELEAERELRGVWDERLQKQYELNLEIVAKKFKTSFKRPTPKEQVLRVGEIGLGFARVFKYGVTGVTPTVVGKPPIPTELIVRPTGMLVPTRIPIRTFDLGQEAKALFRIPLEPKTRIELKAEREIKDLWDEKLQREYELNLEIVAKKFKTSFKRPTPKEQVLRVEEIGIGFARVFKYGVKGVTPTVVGKLPVPGPGIYTGRQPIIRPISELTLWDWLTGKPIKPSVQKEPLFKIFPIKMKPLKYTLKDIVKEPKIEPGDFITKEGQILKTVTKVETKPPMFRPKFARPEPRLKPLDVFEDYEFVRNEIVENFGRITGKPTGKIDMHKDMLSLFPILKARPKVRTEIDVGVKTTLDRDMTRMQSQFPISKISQDVTLDIAKLYDTSQMQTQAEMQKFDFRTDILSIEETATAQVSAMDIASMQDLIQEQITTTKFKTTKVMGVLPDTPYKLFGHTTGQGYNVKVRERHIVKGKKIKEGKFIRVNKKPLSLRNAESLRGMVLDNSAAASGKIVPVNAMAQEPLINLKPFENIAHKFYLKDDILIEKRKHRIDTKGEVEGISALGWYADKAGKAIKKKQVVQKRKERRRQVDMFDTGMDDMLINIDKVFKGVFNFGF